MPSKEQQAEAISRIQALTKAFDLNPNILRYFREGKLYYSYLTAGGLMSSIDKITYDPRYESAVKEFEAMFGGLVYHAIESNTGWGKMLSLLYVGGEADEWPVERPDRGRIMTYTVNLDDPDLSDFGDVEVTGVGGALIRVA